MKETVSLWKIQPWRILLVIEVPLIFRKKAKENMVDGKFLKIL